MEKYIALVENVQLTFMIVSLFTVAFLIYAKLIKKLDLPLIIRAIIFSGICLRISYTIFTGPGTRTYDVYREKWGHLEYIKYIAQNFSLPPVNECQTYHPPLHHIISALAMNVSGHFTQNESIQIKLIQFVMVLLSSLTLVIFYGILKEMKCGNVVILTGVAFFAFHPNNIYFSSRINNDNTMLFFYTLAIYFLVKWVNNKSIKNIVLLSITSALAVLAKLSGIMLAPVIVYAFIMVSVKNRSSLKIFINQFAVFVLIYVPMSMSYQMRNYILFNQQLVYVPDLGQGFRPTFFNLLYIPVNEMVDNPFNKGGLVGGEFFMEFFLKSSLFGEWYYTGLEKVAVILIFLAAVLGLVVLICLLLVNKKGTGNFGGIFILNLIIPILLEMKLRTDLPIACSQDFRYAAPVLLSAAIFLGEAVRLLKNSRFKLLAYPVIGCIAAFCVTSAVFVLSLGYYN